MTPSVANEGLRRQSIKINIRYSYTGGERKIGQLVWRVRSSSSRYAMTHDGGYRLLPTLYLLLQFPRIVLSRQTVENQLSSTSLVLTLLLLNLRARKPPDFQRGQYFFSTSSFPFLSLFPFFPDLLLLSFYIERNNYQCVV